MYANLPPDVVDTIEADIQRYRASRYEVAYRRFIKDKKPKQQRDWAAYEAVVLARREGKTFRQISEITGLTQGRVRQKLEVAMRYMRFAIPSPLAHLMPMTDDEIERFGPRVRRCIEGENNNQHIVDYIAYND